MGDQEDAVPCVRPEAGEHVGEAKRIAGFRHVRERLEQDRVRTLRQEALHPLQLALVAFRARNAGSKGDLTLKVRKRPLRIKRARVSGPRRGTPLTLRAGKDGCSKSQGNQAAKQG
jgi:hypothetical protein